MPTLFGEVVGANLVLLLRLGLRQIRRRGFFIYVVDRGNARIQKFDANGAFLLKWNVQATDQPITIGVNPIDTPVYVITYSTFVHLGRRLRCTADADGILYVVDSYNNRIQIIGM